MLFVLETGFGGRVIYTIPLGLIISKQLQANRNHSHSLWYFKKEADLFPSQSFKI